MKNSIPSRQNLLNLEKLKALGAKPHWFGLGFVQLKLSETLRVHFWHPDMVGNTAEEELHDHRYDFTSTVLLGSFSHELWGFEASSGGRYEKIEVSCKPGESAQPRVLDRGEALLRARVHIPAGQSYRMPADLYHRTQTRHAVTLLERGPVIKDFARVLRPVGTPWACPFSAPRSEEECWQVIGDVLSFR